MIEDIDREDTAEGPMRDETDTDLRVVIPQPRTAPFVAYGCDWCGQKDQDPAEPQDDWDLALEGFEVWGETCHCGAPMREENGQWVCQDPYCGGWQASLPGVLSPELIATGEVNCGQCGESNEPGACKRCGNPC
ncbi:hypothetical protein ACFT8W_21010 [Streptomyces hygroscopicus]|uniref:hypothetical protein n=1 Tax=Streptomyces hygroscopicus TaxID=1912 RepID=UPI00362F07C2